MCFKKYRIENVQISSEMKRDTCSATVRNHQRLRVRCSSGPVLGLYWLVHIPHLLLIPSGAQPCS